MPTLDELLDKCKDFDVARKVVEELKNPNGQYTVASYSGSDASAAQASLHGAINAYEQNHMPTPELVSIALAVERAEHNPQQAGTMKRSRIFSSDNIKNAIQSNKYLQHRLAESYKSGDAYSIANETFTTSDAAILKLTELAAEQTPQAKQLYARAQTFIPQVEKTMRKNEAKRWARLFGIPAIAAAPFTSGVSLAVGSALWLVSYAVTRNRKYF